MHNVFKHYIHRDPYGVGARGACAIAQKKKDYLKRDFSTKKMKDHLKRNFPTKKELPKTHAARNLF